MLPIPSSPSSFLLVVINLIFKYGNSKGHYYFVDTPSVGCHGCFFSLGSFFFFFFSFVVPRF